MSPAERRSLFDAARPTCAHDGCDKPVLRAEIAHRRNATGAWVADRAVLVCEFGHRTDVDPDAPGD